MKDAWIRARAAYERTEGAIAPLFPDIDPAVDARYDDFLASSGRRGSGPLRRQGVTGMHGIERISSTQDDPGVRGQDRDRDPRLQGAPWPATEGRSRRLQGPALAASSSPDTPDPARRVEAGQAIDLATAFRVSSP